MIVSFFPSVMKDTLFLDMVALTVSVPLRTITFSKDLFSSKLVIVRVAPESSLPATSCLLIVTVVTSSLMEVSPTTLPFSSTVNSTSTLLIV